MSALLIILALVLLFTGVVLLLQQMRELMKASNPIAKLEPHSVVVTLSARETDAELTSKAEAKSANKLSRAEQLSRFEQDLAVHDSGNQPA